MNVGSHSQNNPRCNSFDIGPYICSSRKRLILAFMYEKPLVVRTHIHVFRSFQNSLKILVANTLSNNIKMSIYSDRSFYLLQSLNKTLCFKYIFCYIILCALSYRINKVADVTFLNKYINLRYFIVISIYHYFTIIYPYVQ